MQVELIKPTIERIEKQIVKFNDKNGPFNKYAIAESILNEIFSKNKKNTELETVWMKVSLLNDYYSTVVFDTFSLAKHIINMKIDEPLQNGDLNVVNRIGQLINVRNFYSFATKYCSFHEPEKYAIYDNLVARLLGKYNKAFPFYKEKFRINDLRNYILYIDVIKSFSNHFGLSEYSLKDLDKYLWITAKEYFKK